MTEGMVYAPAQNQPGYSDASGVFIRGALGVAKLHGFGPDAVKLIDVRTRNGGGTSIPLADRWAQVRGHLETRRREGRPPLAWLAFACHGFGDNPKSDKPEGGLQLVAGPYLDDLADELSDGLVEHGVELISPWWACSAGDAPLPGVKHGPAERFVRFCYERGFRVRCDAHADRPGTATNEGVGHAFYNRHVSRTEIVVNAPDGAHGEETLVEDWLVSPEHVDWPEWAAQLRRLQLHKRYPGFTRPEVHAYIAANRRP